MTLYLEQDTNVEALFLFALIQHENIQKIDSEVLPRKDSEPFPRQIVFKMFQNKACLRVITATLGNYKWLDTIAQVLIWIELL